MKPILATIALLIVSGCASKPKPLLYPSLSLPGSIYSVDETLNEKDWNRVVLWVRHESDNDRSECERSAYCLTELNNGGMSMVAGPFRVTPSQWEAAQGLYNPKRFEFVGDDPRYDPPLYGDER